MMVFAVVLELLAWPRLFACPVRCWESAMLGSAGFSSSFSISGSDRSRRCMTETWLKAWNPDDPLDKGCLGILSRLVPGHPICGVASESAAEAQSVLGAHAVDKLMLMVPKAQASSGQSGPSGSPTRDRPRPV
ncbi:uncharacterized protein BJX67DRAFT_319140 [Aspergillus lucknowensis]|uniref:Uncharacterized protein n=1 Tax=Aspergillus lucknowensis TaxID=176173 RepID=A0ABR4LYX7_9EURO